MVILSVFQQPESPILFEETDVRAVLDSRDLGIGSLIISERTLCWKEPGGLGFCIEYPHVSMHATAKHDEVYPAECVLVIIDGHITMPGVDVPIIEKPQASATANDDKEKEADDDDDDDDDDDIESEPENSQLILVPSNSNSIRTIYNALNQCQLLNPDPEDAMDDEEENVYEDAEEFNEDEFVSDGRLNDLGAGGDTEMNHLSSQLRNHSIHTNYTYGNGDQNFDDDQFEDAD